MTNGHIATRRRQAGRVGSGPVFVGFALIALFFLFTEHRAHLFGWLPFLLLLACPLLHLFHGHGNHVGHEEDAHDSEEGRASSTAKAPQSPTQNVSHHHH
ncbi:DUF2933 domain-containing protein [Ralstonia holmesii]|uniref:DUF2933 domain-containing protein n=1 Tax=Ralstonia holmesii TaxID=3058602 RepID=UPI0028F50BDE|nr:DUF2933 domain-containing protein [Ralstonia sp. LMG 32967]CAJ0683982.1 hypothetical protein R11007_00219 [Ralstonia sp. LMG 32967]